MKLVSVSPAPRPCPTAHSQPRPLWLPSSPSESWGSPPREGASLSGSLEPPGLCEAKNLGCPCSGETDWAIE